MRKIVLRAVGDMMVGDTHMKIGTGVRSLARKRGSPYLFEEIAPRLGGGEGLLFGNLECPVSAGPNRRRPFLGDPSIVDAMKEAGFDVLALANNHMMEHGEGPPRETERILSAAGIEPVGLPFGRGTRAIVERGGVRVGFLAHNFVRTPKDDPFEHDGGAIFREAEALVKECDAAVVSLHWGAEFVRFPSKEQIAFARALVRAGVRAVLGHHTHTVQSVEVFEDGVIAYNLGNFLFDMDWIPFAQEGILLTASIPIERGAAPEATVLPLRLDETYRPVPAGEKMSAEAFHESLVPGRSMDDLLRFPRNDYTPHTWSERRRAGEEMRARVRRNPSHVPPASWLYLFRKRLRRGAPTLRADEVDASWTLEGS
ncbi:MAG: CapA family protein [Candidatus Eisenbacteria bacterium]